MSLDRDSLKQRADELGIEFAKNIPTEKLAELVAVREADLTESAEAAGIDVAEFPIESAVHVDEADEPAPRILIDGKPCKYQHELGMRHITITAPDRATGSALMSAREVSTPFTEKPSRIAARSITPAGREPVRVTLTTQDRVS